MGRNRPSGHSPSVGGRRLRCAIYTRKSTEDGLEQEFNSLDAQQEACAAYVLSQRHEGWTLLPDRYDDGGFSGGNMDRPGLKQLLAAVKAGKVDIIVVYKVDRLTRSLVDFAKIVEILDGASASFVSVTQAFNTTTSMGRLTLNVLLSFAQFEREVTGERIRDKIAASKAKGMWMGGSVPMGYEVRDRKLVVHEQEAATVRRIFERYLQLGSVPTLQWELEGEGVRSRLRTSRNGRQYGGSVLTNGALYHLLQNRIYLGEICHRGKAHPGEHKPIVPMELFTAAQTLLARNRVARQCGENADEPSLLSGILSDDYGRRMSPSHTVRRSKRYRYYVSVRDPDADQNARIWRIPASDLENVVLGRLIAHLSEYTAIPSLARKFADADPALSAFKQLAELQATATTKRTAVLQLVERVKVSADGVAIHLARDCSAAGGEEDKTTLEARAVLMRAGKQVRMLVQGPQSDQPANLDPALIKLLVKADRVRRVAVEGGYSGLDELAERQGLTCNYITRLLRLSFLAPPIVEAILAGRQPPALTRQKLARLPGLPMEWDQQRLTLGFP